MPPGKELSQRARRLASTTRAMPLSAIRSPCCRSPPNRLRRYEPIATWELPPPPPKFPLVVGVVNFPFYLKTMPVWLFLPMSWIAGFLSLMGALWLAENGDPPIVARFIMPVWPDLLCDGVHRRLHGGHARAYRQRLRRGRRVAAGRVP